MSLSMGTCGCRFRRSFSTESFLGFSTKSSHNKNCFSGAVTLLASLSDHPESETNRYNQSETNRYNQYNR